MDPTDHWPTSEDIDHFKESKRPPLADIMPKDSRIKPPASDPEEDDSAFGDSFVVRRKLSAPDGEEDSTLNNKEEEHQQNNRNHRDKSPTMPPPSSSSSTNSRTTRSSRSGRKQESLTYSENDDDDDRSIAELTNYSSGVDLHPHHKRRGGGGGGGGGDDKKKDKESSRHRSSSNHRQSSSDKNKGSDTERRHRSSSRHHDRDDVRGRSRREADVSDGGRGVVENGRAGESSRRRKPSSSHYHSEDDYHHGEEEGRLLGPDGRPSSHDRHRRRTRSGRSSGGRPSGVFGVITSFFEGINMKTVLLCILGMAVVMKMNKSPPPPNDKHGVESTGSLKTEDVKPHVRGASVKMTESYEDNDKDEEDDDDEEQEEEEEEEQQPAPPSSLTQQQQQPMQQQITSAVSPQATMQQFDPQQVQQLQQQGYIVPQDQQMIMQQQGYMVQQQQQQNLPMMADQYGQSNAGFAVGQQSAYNQPPVPVVNQQPMTYQQQPQQYSGAIDASMQLLQQQQQQQHPVSSYVVQDSSQQQQQQQVAPQAVVDASAAGPPPAPNALLDLLSNFKNNWDPWEKTDIPMFWHIPKAGGSSIKDAMGGCHRFVQATEFGVTDGHDQDTEVAIVYPKVPGGADTDRSPFVNIDSSTVAGIQRAKSMGFADAQLANVVVSPFVFELNDLFTPTAKGRFFSVFRHPIERAVSMFYYIQVADWEPSYKPELKEWTLEQYATSEIVENNWMTRQLSNQLGGELTDENLRNAMAVVQSKFLVGLMSQIEPTMARCEKFFRWTFHVNPTNQEACRERLMSGGSNSNAKNKKPLAEGDPAWDLLAHQNNFDMQLYSYIEQLFKEQEAFVTGLPDNFRNVGATCCKCDPPTYPPEGFTCPQAVKNG